ncbi:holo-ACP synthase [Leucobacter sp.]
MIVGIGVDTVDIARFERQLERTPKMLARLFTAAEARLAVPSLAARFAAKEALIKALGGSAELRWHDMEVVRDRDRAPSFVATAGLQTALAARGAQRVHLSMTHDGGSATAFVVVESHGSAASAPMPAARGTLATRADTQNGTGQA